MNFCLIHKEQEEILVEFFYVLESYQFNKREKKCIFCWPIKNNLNYMFIKIGLFIFTVEMQIKFMKGFELYNNLRCMCLFVYLI